MVVERMRIEGLALETDRFSSSYPPEHPPLRESLDRVGMLQPLLVTERGGRLVVILGHRRLRAAREAGMETAPCRVLENPPPDEAALFRLNLEDNLASRPLNLLERSRAAVRLERDPSLAPRLRSRYLERLGVPGSRRLRGAFLEMDRFEDGVKRFLLERNLSDRTACLLAGLSPEARALAVRRARRFRLTASQVREMILFASETAARESVGFPRVLEEAASGLPAREEEGGDRVRDRFLDRLRAMRMPGYTSARARVEAVLSRVEGVPGVRVAPPPFLEGDTFSARIEFRDPGTLAEAARALEAFARTPELAALFEDLERGTLGGAPSEGGIDP